MNPHQNSNKNPASTSAVQQVNPVLNQPMFNGGLFPNNMPVVAPPCFMNFPNQPFPLQNTQFPNGFVPFPVNQFNIPPQQQVQFLAHNSMNPTGEQVLMQNTIQNIYQLLQLQNSNYSQCNLPVFQNPMNQQLGMSSSNGPQGSPFLPGASGSAQPQNLHANFQNQIPQGAGPQNPNLFTNQMFGMPNFMPNINQGPPGFVSPMTDANASRQMVNTGQMHNPAPTVKNFEENHKNGPTNTNGRWTGSQHKNFTAHKTYDASHKGFQSHKHVKEKFGMYKGNMSKGDDNNLAVDSGMQNSNEFEKKIPSLVYTEKEIKEWREARRKNHPSNNQQNATNQEAMLRRQQLKEILAKQAELGCEVADIPPSYLSGPREKKYERHHKKGRFHNKRGKAFQGDDQMAKKPRRRDQHSFKPNHRHRHHQTELNKQEPSLLQKLLARDIKRDKNHLLQVLRFITANSFFANESLVFPPVIVRETNVDAPSSQENCSVFAAPVEKENHSVLSAPVNEEEERISSQDNCSVFAAPVEKENCSVMSAPVNEEEEEGEIID